MDSSFFAMYPVHKCVPRNLMAKGIHINLAAQNSS